MSSVQTSLFKDDDLQEDPDYLTKQLITYIGNKRSLLPFIESAVIEVSSRLGRKKLECLDLFAGSGIVSRLLKAYSSVLVSNDLETYSRISLECYLTNKESLIFSDLSKLLDDITHQIKENPVEGFITDLYSPKDENNISASDRVFYTRRNAVYLDSARTYIGELPSNIQKYFIAPLLSLASVHANTSGVFKGFYKSRDGVGQFGGSGRDALSRIKAPINLCLPVLSNHSCDYRIYQLDANDLVRQLRDNEFDLTYLDPPYNQHPYGSNYFMLNLLADYKRPSELSRVSGIPKSWNRSDYNKRGMAAAALFDVVENLNSRFILISYNSEGFVSHNDFVDVLSSYGSLKSMETRYNTFRGCRNLANRETHVTEYLYLLEKS